MRTRSRGDCCFYHKLSGSKSRQRAELSLIGRHMNQKNRAKDKSRNSLQRGHSLVEVAFGSLLVAVMAAIAVDMTIATIAFTILDSTARDCARAAGSQSTSALATKAATSQLNVHKTDGYFCQQPQLVGNALVTYQDWNAAPYNGTPPTLTGSNPSTIQCAYVTVQCSENVRLPINISFFGANTNSILPGSIITFYRAYTYPIVKVKYSQS